MLKSFLEWCFVVFLINFAFKYNAWHIMKIPSSHTKVGCMSNGSEAIAKVPSPSDS